MSGFRPIDVGGGGGGGLSPEQEDAVDSIVNLPDGEVPKALSGELVVSGEAVDSVSGEHTFDKSINVPQSSLNVSDTLSISEATIELVVHDHITETTASGVASIITDAGSQPLTWQFLGVKSTITPQPVFDTEFNANPFSAPLLSSALNQTDAVTFKTGAIMTNVRMTITDDITGLVVKYIPDKAAVTSGVGGLDLIVGDNRFDFNSDDPDVPLSGLFSIGFTPLRQLAGQASTLEIEADSVSILGESGGVPFFQNEIQFITPKIINPEGEVINAEPRTFYFSKGGDDTKDGAGSSVENPTLTIQAAIDQVNALTPSPDASNPSSIIGLGFGNYNESIVVPGGCLFAAENSSITSGGTSVATVEMSADSTLKIDSVTSTGVSGDAILIDGSSNVSITSRIVEATNSSSNGLRISGASSGLFVNMKVMTCSGLNSAGIFDQSTSPGTRVYNIDEIALNGDSSLCVFYDSSDASAQGVFNIGSINQSGGASNTQGITINDGSASVIINDIDADTAITVNTSGALHITANKVLGDILANGIAVFKPQIINHVGSFNPAATADVEGYISNEFFGDKLVNGELSATGDIIAGV